MGRCALVVGNWKMNGRISSSKDRAKAIVKGVESLQEQWPKHEELCEVVLCPPFTALTTVQAATKKSIVEIGGQNMAIEKAGAFTGEISGNMLNDVECRYVILGHSERRALFKEINTTIAKKTATAFKENLIPIVCVGETLEERQEGDTLHVVRGQIDAIIPHIPPEPEIQQKLVIAYEPVWAIGTGQQATPEQAEEVHRYIRETLAAYLGKEISEAIRILYGGSVKPDNAEGLFSNPNVDGGLIGGAALDAKTFLAIIEAALKTQKKD
ncbi:triose-phosphate isomerase [Magnetococcales bacterium HHB-1]